MVWTLEVADLASCPGGHPLVKHLRPTDLAERGLPRFDGFVQFSSVEHSGLGRYGDELNPWADVQTIAKLWCLSKEGAWFLFGPWEAAADEIIYFNAGRSYGPVGTTQLMLNWKLRRPALSNWHSHLFRRLPAAK